MSAEPTLISAALVCDAAYGKKRSDSSRQRTTKPSACHVSVASKRSTGRPSWMPCSRTGSCRTVAAVRSSMARSFLTRRMLRKRHPELALPHRLLLRRLDSLHVRAGGAAAAPRDDRLDALDRPFEHGLDEAVRPVAHPPTE